MSVLYDNGSLFFVNALLFLSAERLRTVCSIILYCLFCLNDAGSPFFVQDEVAALKRQLWQRELQVRRRDAEVIDLKAQVAAGAFI